jgi:hypothetical protein
MKRQGGSLKSNDETSVKRIEADSSSEPDDSSDSSGSEIADSDSGCSGSEGSFLTRDDPDTDEETRAAVIPESRMSFIQYRRRTRKIIHRYQHIRNQIAIAGVEQHWFDPDDLQNLLLCVDLHAPGVTIAEVEAFEKRYRCRMPDDARAVLSVVNGGALRRILSNLLAVLRSRQRSPTREQCGVD